LSIIQVEVSINPSNAELNPICHLLAFLGDHHFLHDRMVRVKRVKLMSYRRFRTVFASYFGKSTNERCKAWRLISVRYIKLKNILKPLKMAVVCGAELNFPDSLLIFVLCVVTSSFRELAVTSVSESDDRRCLRS
jgi:hypothetical protein